MFSTGRWGCHGGSVIVRAASLAEETRSQWSCGSGSWHQVQIWSSPGWVCNQGWWGKRIKPPATPASWHGCRPPCLERKRAIYNRERENTICALDCRKLGQVWSICSNFTKICQCTKTFYLYILLWLMDNKTPRYVNCLTKILIFARRLSCPRRYWVRGWLSMSDGVAAGSEFNRCLVHTTWRHHGDHKSSANGSWGWSKVFWDIHTQLVNKLGLYNNYTYIRKISRKILCMNYYYYNISWLGSEIVSLLAFAAGIGAQAAHGIVVFVVHQMSY